MGDPKPGGERLFYQAGAQGHFPQRESTSEHPPVICFRHVAPRLYRALPALHPLNGRRGDPSAFSKS
jgi:hypothetical protein